MFRMHLPHSLCMPASRSAASVHQKFRTATTSFDFLYNFTTVNSNSPEKLVSSLTTPLNVSSAPPILYFNWLNTVRAGSFKFYFMSNTGVGILLLHARSSAALVLIQARRTGTNISRSAESRSSLRSISTHRMRHSLMTSIRSRSPDTNTPTIVPTKPNLNWSTMDTPVWSCMSCGCYISISYYELERPIDYLYRLSANQPLCLGANWPKYSQFKFTPVSVCGLLPLVK